MCLLNLQLMTRHINFLMLVYISSNYLNHINSVNYFIEVQLVQKQLLLQLVCCNILVYYFRLFIMRLVTYFIIIVTIIIRFIANFIREAKIVIRENNYYCYYCCCYYYCLFLQISFNINFFIFTIIKNLNYYLMDFQKIVIIVAAFMYSSRILIQI